MKTVPSFKNILSTAFLSLIFLALQSFYDGSKKLKTNDEITAQVNYVGVSEDYFLFRVSFAKLNLENRKKVEIKILTNDKDEIFAEQYSNSQMSTIFKISKAEVEKISFRIANKGKINNYRFNVRSSYQETVNVIRIN
ncbi:MAG: hypothetical protein ABJA37_00330 [Ferruginibacter sp.]